MRSIFTLALLALITFVGGQSITDKQYRESLGHFRAGMQALETERYEQAETEFQAAITLDRDFDAAFYGLGQVYMRTRRYERAIRAYIDCREAFKRNVAAEAMGTVDADRRLRDQIDVLRDQVRNLQRVSQSSTAVNVSSSIDRLNDQIHLLESRRARAVAGSVPPVPAGVSMALGSAYFRLGQHADAEREYKAALTVDPKFGEAHSNLAVVYLVTGRYDEADQEVKAAEKAGYQVNPRLKDDIRKRRSGGVSD
jgi:tetratricopeptide (TPR) repeat protein